MLGRIEQGLLGVLALCAVVIGGLTWHSAASQTPPVDSAAQRTAAARSVESAASRDNSHGGTATPSGAHVRAEVVRSGYSAPDRDVERIKAQIASGERGTYIANILAHNDSSTTRWPDRNAIPVKVWIEARSAVPGWSADLVSLAERALNSWRNYDIPIRFEQVADSAAADIVVVWTDRFTGSHVGATKRFRDQHGWIVRAEITLALRTPAGAPIEKNFQSAIAIHEVGHALGLDHSGSSADIMAEKNAGVFEPTVEDRATLSLIYAIPPGTLGRRNAN